MISTNSYTSYNLFGASMDLMPSTLNESVLTLYFLTHKLRHSVYAITKNYFSTFKFNPASAIFYKNLSRDFSLSANSCCDN